MLDLEGTRSLLSGLCILADFANGEGFPFFRRRDLPIQRNRVPLEGSVQKKVGVLDLHGETAGDGGKAQKTDEGLTE